MIVGVDPGISGAVCFLERDGPPSIHPLPLRKFGYKDEVCSRQLNRLIQAMLFPRVDAPLFVIEEVGGDPSFGGSRAFNFGKTFGTILAVLESFGFEVARVRPQLWKKHVLTPDDHSKDAAIRLIQSRWPGINLIPPGAKKPSHDWAEACCLALYGKEHHQ